MNRISTVDKMTTITGQLFNDNLMANITNMSRLMTGQSTGDLSNQSDTLASSLNITNLSTGEQMDMYTVTTRTVPNGIFDQNLSILNGTQPDIIHNKIIQLTFCLLYAAIFVLGVFGNVLVCYVVFRNKAMQTVTNLFITNLALSDILLCTFAVPFTPMYTFLRRWIFGTVFCHLLPYAQGCSVYISTFTLTSIAIDRFFVIIYPFHPRMRLSTCICIMLGIWNFSLLVTSPYGLYMTVIESNFTGTTNTFCEETWPSEHYRKLFGSITSTLQFFIPFLIISICYVCVSMRLNDRAKTKPGAKTTKKEEVERDRKKRTNRMLIAMVAVFGISWLPLNVVNVINDFYANINDWQYYNVIFFIAHSIAMSSTCYNPFLYAWLNDNFRKEFKQVLPCFSPSTRRKSLAGSQRWQPEPTFNGNNETVQESLLSYTRTTPYGRESIQMNGIRNSISFQEQSVLLADIGTCNNQIKSKQRSPETIILPSGVLETNFEDPIDDCLMGQRKSIGTNSANRIRFQDELGGLALIGNGDNLNVIS